MFCRSSFVRQKLGKMRQVKLWGLPCCAWCRGAGERSGAVSQQAIESIMINQIILFPILCWYIIGWFSSQADSIKSGSNWRKLRLLWFLYPRCFDRLLREILTMIQHSHAPLQKRHRWHENKIIDILVNSEGKCISMSFIFYKFKQSVFFWNCSGTGIHRIDGTYVLLGSIPFSEGTE